MVTGLLLRGSDRSNHDNLQAATLPISNQNGQLAIAHQLVITIMSLTCTE